MWVDRHGVVLSRLAAFLSALVILYMDTAGSLATKRSIKGASEQMFIPSNHYTQSFLPQYVEALAKKSPTTQLTAAPPNASVVQVHYLDAKDAADSSTLAFAQTGCLEPQSGDHIYDASYVTTVLHLILDDQTWHSINLTTALVLVDCSYQGRTLGDTTAWKVHVLDATRENLTSIFIQTMGVARPTKHWQVSCGTATISTLRLSSLHVDVETNSVVSSDVAVYNIMIGMEFPYVNPPFEHVILDNQMSTTGEWAGIVVATGEPIVVSGSTGTYRYSPQTQGRYDYFVWQLPKDPLAYLSTIQWVTVVYSVDSWAWVRYILDMGISVILAAHIVVGIVASYNIYRSQGVVWIPDVYPSIQAEIITRCVLLILVCIISQWWHIFEYCMVKSTARQSWGYNEFVQSSIVCSDLQVVILAFLQGVAMTLQLRLHVTVVLATYYVCYLTQNAIVGSIQLNAAEAASWLYSNYMENTLIATGGMDMWAYHINYDTSWAVIASELVWYIIAISAATTYALSVAIVVARRRRLRSRVLAGPCAKTIPVPATEVTDQHWDRLSSTYLMKHVSQQLSLLDIRHIFPQADASTELTVFERTVRRNCLNTYGLVAPFAEHEVERGSLVATHSLIWLLGYVILRDEVVISVVDVPMLWCNALLRKEVGAVYGYRLTPEKDTIEPQAQRLFLSDFSGADLFSISIKPLR
ncbi:hypothetical protein ACHHYP_10337 [Achlya hypogyna]|uniref:Transmembrane protein n=1 Tax=Achlya hypogyna TaxID=1202772 RepID=A0A1V9YLQ5_ACHHY|nr:hypothetical protein ACHHYP_10337 [Achlya hypogyna]